MWSHHGTHGDKAGAVGTDSSPHTMAPEEGVKQVEGWGRETGLLSQEDPSKLKGNKDISDTGKLEEFVTNRQEIERTRFKLKISGAGGNSNLQEGMARSRTSERTSE